MNRKAAAIEREPSDNRFAMPDCRDKLYDDGNRDFQEASTKPTS